MFKHLFVRSNPLLSAMNNETGDMPPSMVDEHINNYVKDGWEVIRVQAMGYENGSILIFVGLFISAEKYTTWSKKHGLPVNGTAQPVLA